MKELQFNSMNGNLTLWENTKAFFDIPEQSPFKAVLDVDETIINDILYHYGSIPNEQYRSWKGSTRYTGIPLNYCPLDSYLTYRDVYEHTDRRLSYKSTIAFNAYTDTGLYFKSFIEPFNFVRGKIARLSPGKFIGDWHTDEDSSEVLKVVVPLRTDDSYTFQIEGKPPFNLSVGQALLFDASVPHRILCDGKSTTYRDYLILSIPVWFSIDGNLNISKSDYFGQSIPHVVYERCSLFKLKT